MFGCEHVVFRCEHVVFRSEQVVLRCEQTVFRCELVVYGCEHVVFFLLFFLYRRSLSAGLPLTSCLGSLGHILCRGPSQCPFSLLPPPGLEP